jgi:hypothetical protein
MLDGLQAIQARIAQIQSLGGSAPMVRAPVTTAAPTTTSFADALSNATADTAALTPAVKGSPGSYGSVQIPPELQRYGNGKIPESALQPIGVGDYRLSSKAAMAFRRMRADASASGITIGVNDAYRTYEEQVDLARRKGLYSQGGLAATPGKSNHGWGMAVDLELDSRAQAWMRENGYKYGFVEDVAREPWHWTYRPA